MALFDVVRSMSFVCEFILSRVYPASSPPLFKCEDAWMFVESVQLTELTCEHKLNFLKIKQQNEVKLSRALVIS